jgi:hypothetical protein
MERMSTLDAEFFFAEHRNVPMHIGSVAVFSQPPLIPVKKESSLALRGLPARY